jgi:hypothetical protein
VKSKGWKLPNILVFSTPVNRENLFTSLATPQQAHCFVNVSMEMIEGSNVTFVTDGHILPLIIIVAKLPR